MRIKGTYILRAKLISIYKQMKRNTREVYVSTGFPGGYYSNLRHLETLKLLGLIEQVPVIYYCGPKRAIKRTVKGWRLLNQKRIDETINETT